MSAPTPQHEAHEADAVEKIVPLMPIVLPVAGGIPVRRHERAGATPLSASCCDAMDTGPRIAHQQPETTLLTGDFGLQALSNMRE